MSFYWSERTMCDVLEEMRAASKAKNYSYIDGLIEEVQSMGNRMEAGLEKYGSIAMAEKQVANTKNEIKALDREVQALYQRKSDAEEGLAALEGK
jgi:hypothetical protein